MEKLPSSFRNGNRTTRRFRDRFAKLPNRIKEIVRDQCRLFNENPDHPSLRRHKLDDKKTGSHRSDSFSVAITMSYRAVYVEEGSQNIWYWIGTHAEYDQFAG